MAIDTADSGAEREKSHGEETARRRPVRVGLLGLGTVGSAVWQLLERYAASIESKVGAPVEVHRVLVRDPHKERPVAVHNGRLTTDPGDILENPDIDVVVELLGGVEPAYPYIRTALEAGKDVITANKDVMAEHGRELERLAKAKGVGIFFEASVGGGIPVIQVLQDSLVANRIHTVYGVLNGTTNYILTRMSEDGASYAEALRQAQELGYAEADPTADVDGWDAARKIAILAGIAFSASVELEDVFREGIGGITARDIQDAAELGFVIKLLAVAREVDGALSLRVHPAFMPKSHPLASVRESFNAVYIEGDPVGQVMLYGQGAGGGPTASAVVGDLMLAARSRVHGYSAPGSWVGPERRRILPIEEERFPYYLRLNLANRPGTLAKVAAVLGRHEVNLKSVLQKGSEGAFAEVVLVTYPVAEGNLQAARRELLGLEVVGAVESIIRMEGGMLD